MYKQYPVPEYNRSRIHLTPGQMCTNQKGVYMVKNSRRDTTPSKEIKECIARNQAIVFHHPQFPVQMQHIRLNQLEADYSSSYQLNSIDMTPQRSIPKGVPAPFKQQNSTSQLHHSNESQVNRINVNLSLKQFQQNPQNQQHPLKQIHQNSAQKTPIGSSQKVSPPVYVGEDPQRTNFKFGKENCPSELQQQLTDIRRQKENICITLSETFKKNQSLTQRVQELTRQLDEQKQNLQAEHGRDIECLQEKIIELTNANTNLSNVSSQYSIKLQQMEMQLKTQRQTDLKKINDLSEEVNRLIHAKEELSDEMKNLRRNRNEVLEMNQSLESELKDAAALNAELQNNLYQLERQQPPPRQIKDSHVAIQLLTDANHLSSLLNEPLDQDSLVRMQVSQLHSMVEMLKCENQILYTALQQ